MRSRLRRSAFLGAAAVTAAASLLALTTPSDAATVPEWPSSGRVPVGCPITALASTPGGPQATYVDSADPVVTGWAINGHTTTVVLPVGGTPLTWTLRAQQQCSGVADTATGIVHWATATDGGWDVISLEASGTDAFDQRLTSTQPASVDSAGWYRTAFVVTSRRYDTFVLDGDFATLDVTAAADTVTLSGPWSRQTVYVLLSTRMTATASRSSVAKGTVVLFKARLSKAGETDWVPAEGSRVVLQTRLPGHGWVTRAAATVDATGVASARYAPRATSQWRFVHVSDRTTHFTAGSSTAPAAIRVR